MRGIKHLSGYVANSLSSSIILYDLARVIEELVFNSLEAGASKVQVCISISTSYVKVEDDGCGISRDSLAFLGEKYATSKVNTMVNEGTVVENYHHRGGTLTSLSSISFLEVITKARGRPNAYQKIIKDGTCLFLGIDDLRRAVGTTVVVSDLFHKQPVRRKQMQCSPKKVLLSAKKFVLRIALVHPQISFKIVDIDSDEVLLSTVPSPCSLHLVNARFGNEVATCLQKVTFCGGVFNLSGYLSIPMVTPVKAIQYIYINSRFVCKSPIHRFLNVMAANFPLSFGLQRVDQDSQSVKKQKTERCSAFLLNLYCPHSCYSLNFEPGKTAVEFKDWRPVLSFIEDAVHDFWHSSSDVYGRHHIYKESSRAGELLPGFHTSRSLLGKCQDKFSLCYQDYQATSSEFPVCAKECSLEKAHFVDPASEDSADVSCSHIAVPNFINTSLCWGKDLTEIQNKRNKENVHFNPEYSSEPCKKCFFEQSFGGYKSPFSGHKNARGYRIPVDSGAACACGSQFLDFPPRNSLKDVTATWFSSPILKRHKVSCDVDILSNHIDTQITDFIQGELHGGEVKQDNDVRSLELEKSCSSPVSIFPDPWEGDTEVKCKFKGNPCDLRKDRYGHHANLGAENEYSVETFSKADLPFTKFAPACKNGFAFTENIYKICQRNPHSANAVCAGAVSYPKLIDTVNLFCGSSYSAITSSHAASPFQPNDCSDQVEFAFRRSHDFFSVRKRSSSAPPCYKGKKKFFALQTHLSVPEEPAVHSFCKIPSLPAADQAFESSRFSHKEALVDGSHARFRAYLNHKPHHTHGMDGMSLSGERLERWDVSWPLETEEGALTGHLQEAQVAASKLQSKEIKNTVENIHDSFMEEDCDVLDISSGLLYHYSSFLVPEFISKNFLVDAKVLFQLDKKFIPVSSGGILSIIDQHAADERIRLEELREKVLSGEEKRITRLDNELDLVLPEIEFEWLQNYMEHVKSWGWICRIHVHDSRSFTRNLNALLTPSRSAISIVAVPCVLGINLSARDLTEFLKQLAETDGSSTIPPAVTRILNFKACRGAIMFGDALLPSECSLIVEELKKTSLYFQCAHGRPTTVPLVNLQVLHKQLAKLQSQCGADDLWHGFQKHRPSLERAKLCLKSCV